MPQREFWTTRIPVEFSVRYQTDPRHPEDAPTVMLVVLDQSGVAMDRASFRVPLNVLHEAVADAMGLGWDAYLFGEIGGLERAIAPAMKRWRQESLLRAPV